jgi:Sec-independent protein secretion pathway component TatC
MKTKTIEARAASSLKHSHTWEEVYNKVPYELQCLVPASAAELKTSAVVAAVIIVPFISLYLAAIVMPVGIYHLIRKGGKK